MEKRITLLIFLIFAAFTMSAREVSLFDSKGNAAAYIDYDDEVTIYLWNGKPVVFLENDDIPVTFDGDQAGGQGILCQHLTML